MNPIMKCNSDFAVNHCFQTLSIEFVKVYYNDFSADIRFRGFSTRQKKSRLGAYISIACHNHIMSLKPSRISV